MGFIKAEFGCQMIQTSIIRTGVVSNKIAKPLLCNLKCIKDIANNFCVVDSWVLAELCGQSKHIIHHTAFLIKVIYIHASKSKFAIRSLPAIKGYI